MSFVQLSLEYFPDPTRGVPVYNGYIYVGEPDTDPEIVGNQKTVVLRLSDGSEVATTQPIRTGAGGVVLYDGSPTQLVVEGNYSIKVLDKRGTEVYYIQNAFGSSAPIDGLTGQGVLLADLKGLEGFADGVTIVTSGRTSFGDSGGGTWVFDSGDLSAKVTADPLSGVYAPPDLSPTGVDGTWVRRLPDGFVTPQMFGAITVDTPDIFTDDCSSGIQAAVDSPYPVFIPSGHYYIASTIIVPHEKIIKGAGGLLEDYSYRNTGGSAAPFQEGIPSHTRIFSDQNINYFSFLWERFYFSGMTCDARQCPTWDKAFYHIDRTGERNKGWGGDIVEVFGIGNREALTGAGAGGVGIHVDLDNATGNYSFVTHMNFQGVFMNLNKGFWATGYTIGAGQFANDCILDIECDGCKQSYVNESISETIALVRHQCRNVLDVTEKDLPAIQLTAGKLQLTFVTFDTSALPDADGYYRNNQAFKNHGVGNSIKAIAKNSWPNSQTNILPQQSEAITTPYGFIPKMQQYDRNHGIALGISELHNVFTSMNSPRRGTATVAFYDGTAVADFATLTLDSATEGIALSTEISIFGEKGLWQPMIDVYTPFLRFTAAAVANKDYVEIHINSLATIKMEQVFVCINSLKSGFDAVQVIELDSDGNALTNLFQYNIGKGVAGSAEQDISFPMSNLSAKEYIIRLIGATAAADVKIIDICGLQTGNLKFRPYMSVAGEQLMYGYLSITDGGLVLPKYTTTQLTDITDVVNTGSSKQEGTCVFNSTLNKPVYATSSADGSTWVDATGTVVHTPV